MNLDWDDIKYFLALYRNKSFLAAAAELQVTHTTVSRRISALEEALQTQLFHRTEQGCRPTREGEQLLPYSEQLESTIISIEGTISGKDRQLTGSLRVSAPDGIGNILLATCLAEFQILNPMLEVELIATPSYHSLAKREIDILITVRKPTSANVVVRKLVNYKAGLFCSREYLEQNKPIIKKSDLKNHFLVGYIEDLLFDQDLRFLSEIDPSLHQRFKSSTVIGQTKAISCGAGIAAIPYFMAHQEEGLVHILPEICFERTFWLQVNPDTRQLARIRAAIDHIAEYFAAQKELFLTPPSECMQ